MESIRSYLLTITASAIICGIIISITDKKGQVGKAIKLLCGIFLTCCVISPVVDLGEFDLSGFNFHYTDEANSAVIYGEKLAAETRSAIITEKAEAYILDKAATMELEIDVEVTLDGNTFVPAEVKIRGDASPYAKHVLSQYMENILGITKENQLWI